MREPEGAAAEGRPLTIRDFKPAVRRIEQVDWPGGGTRVWLLYLHCDEIQASYFAARRWFEDQGQPVDQVASPWLELEFRYQLASRMLLAARDPKRKLLPSVEDVRRELSPNELDYFVGKHTELESGEAASWVGELRDPALRELAQLLALPMTTDPGALLDAVRAKL